MSEIFYHISAIVIFVVILGISIYFRIKADRSSGERISLTGEKWPILIFLRIVGLALWLGVLAYVVNPAWMVWSHILLPDWLRLVGVALGILAAALEFWVFSNLGDNVTPTVLTRRRHTLVTTGPYRWVRHPLYSVSLTSSLAFVLLAGNWYLATMAVVGFLILWVRVPKEEAMLIERFGDEYRNYLERTPRFFPRIALVYESFAKRISRSP